MEVGKSYVPTIFDTDMISSEDSRSSEEKLAADLTQDGIVNYIDMVTVLENYLAKDYLRDDAKEPQEVYNENDIYDVLEECGYFDEQPDNGDNNGDNDGDNSQKPGDNNGTNNPSTNGGKLPQTGGANALMTLATWISFNYRWSYIIVSHDRYFLDNVVSKIIEIEDMESKTYKGNYSSYINQKEEKLIEQMHNYKEQQKEIKSIENTIKDLRDWAMRADNTKFF